MTGFTQDAIRFIKNPARLVGVPDPDDVTDRLLGRNRSTGDAPQRSTTPVGPTESSAPKITEEEQLASNTRTQKRRQQTRRRPLISLEDTTTSRPRIIGL